MYRTLLGPKHSEGSRRLREIMESKGWSLSEVAAKISPKLGRNTVHRWVFGDRLPNRRFAVAIARTLGIPLAAWDQSARKPRATRKAAA